MKGLIFDLDGVVADTTQAHYRSWQRLAAEEGLPFDEERARALLGRTRGDSLDLLLRGRAVTPTKREDMLARKQAYVSGELDAMGPNDALPGVASLLRQARAQQVPVGLASSSSNARRVLDRLKLTAFFDTIADGATVARPKPAPDVFLWVADQLVLSPADCLVIEDSAAGIEAAVAGGFPVVSVGPTPASARHFETLAGLTLTDLLSPVAA